MSAIELCRSLALGGHSARRSSTRPQSEISVTFLADFPVADV
jgi:hypothetical protein